MNLNTESLKETINTKITTKLFEKCSTKIKSRYGFELTATANGTRTLEGTNNWIKIYDAKFEERSIGGYLRDTEYVLKLDSNTFVYIAAGDKTIKSEMALLLMLNQNNYNRNRLNDNIYIYIFGRHARKYMKELKDAIGKCSEGLFIYNVSGSTNNHNNSEEFNSISTEMKLRQLDTLFYDNDVEKKIINHIDIFLRNEYIYKERNLLYKTGILLWGRPGTGKTSLASAIATYYNCSIISIDMNTFSGLDISTLTSSINYDKERYVILLEDIDCVFDSLDREAKDITKDDKKVINKLLQFLDSNSSPNNVIFIATTNHKEKLDEALLRDGRFDLKIEIGGISEETSRRMCKSFNLDKKDIDRIIDEEESFPVNQSHLQNIILSNIKDKQNKEIK